MPPASDIDFDLELVFQKALLEGDSEWNRSTARKLIDTRVHRGDLTKCMPRKGNFSYVHVDFDGLGGIAKVIEDVKKFGRYRALEALSGACLGNDMVNLKSTSSAQPLTNTQKEHYFAVAQKMRQKFAQSLSTV